MKKFSLKAIDEAADKKGGAVKTLWQLFKFIFVSSIVTVIQLVLVNVLFIAMKDFKAALPGFLNNIFTETTVGAGNNNWGYVLPFLLSNAIANTYGYIQNKKTTFKSDAPKYCFVIYIVLLISLILFSTWLQGVIVNALTNTGSSFFVNGAPTFASLAAGSLQALVLFPMEKFVLLKEKKKED